MEMISDKNNNLDKLYYNVAIPGQKVTGKSVLGKEIVAIKTQK